MKLYSQLWYPDEYLGTSKTSNLADFGCVVVSLANLLQKDPIEVNKMLIDGGAFYNDSYIIFANIGRILNVEYERTVQKPDEICIVETHDTSTPQHFFLYDPSTNKMVDPLNRSPEWEELIYNIVSYRVLKGLWQSKEETDEDILFMQSLWHSFGALNLPSHQEKCHLVAERLRGNI